ncbi:MAG: alpha-galactosidase [Planctomycetota bacterium]
MLRLRLVMLALAIPAAVRAQALEGLDDAPRGASGGWPPAVHGDWLVDAVDVPATVHRTGEHTVTLANGLLTRTWRMQPAVACVTFDDASTGTSLLRAVEPEARLVLDGEAFAVGGLDGQPDRAYLRPQWLEQMTPTPSPFACVAVRAVPVTVPITWRRVRHASPAAVWPPAGAGLVFSFRGRDGSPCAGVTVDVHYELYTGIPLLVKWLEMTIDASSSKTLTLDALDVERLALVEGEATVEPQPTWRTPPLHVESDYAFHGMSSTSADVTTHWLEDRAYGTQVSYGLHTPCLLVSRPPIGPGCIVSAAQPFVSYRVYELLLDSLDRERAGLAQRRMYRTVAPWVTENPLMMHIRDARPEAVKLAIDQCADVGFEMAILSFGSGFDVEDRRPENLARAKELVAYARNKGVELGTYSLLASRSIDKANDVVDAATGTTGHAYFGNSPCLQSEWGRAYFEHLGRFFAASGFAVLEHDGSYPGDTCASTTHPGHRGLADSQWKQWQQIRALYAWCRGEGIYLNVPDWYFLSGSSKTGMGYRESNWSLPRREQLLHARQNIHDGTFTKTPSMGWMFVPLTEYHGGGAAATLEPLAQHLDDYEQHLALDLGAGVQACWRGPRLYDSDATRALVTKWVRWFKQHREILESDMVHVRRADGRDLDAWLHVNPVAAERGLAMVFNPLPAERTRRLVFPLYYSGLRQRCSVRLRDGAPHTVLLDERARAEIEVTLPADGFTWLVFTAE